MTAVKVSVVVSVKALLLRTRPFKFQSVGLSHCQAGDCLRDRTSFIGAVQRDKVPPRRGADGMAFEPLLFVPHMYVLP